MKLNFKMEVALMVITSVLCTILLLKILNRLRSALPWRVNCWFCNSNCWVKYPARNSWTCPKCEQYNGFTQDGDYNKTMITTNNQVFQTPKAFHKSPPKNGLCKMCNINQQLKVTQLANFVPMNARNFDEEIEMYRIQLEKAYKLCNTCRKVLQKKLHKEKETLLATKLLENRSPDKKHHRQVKHTRALKNVINNTSMLIATILFILVGYEFYNNLMKYENLPKAVTNIIEIVKSLLDRVCSILKMKIFTTFPYVEAYVNEVNSVQYIDMLPKKFNFKLKTFDHVDMSSQEVLAVVACLLQIIANVRNANTLRYTVVIDLLWTVFVLSIAEIVPLDLLPTSVIKVTSVFTLLLVYQNMKKPGRNIPKNETSPKLVKKLANSTVSSLVDSDDVMTLDSDDDEPLSKFGLHNLSESSNETIGNLNTSLMNGRTFSPRTDSFWTKPNSTFNSTFCVNPVICKSPSSVSEIVFAKPSFSKYQKLAKDDSDSELDESISSLSIGAPTKSKNKTNSIFSLRKFTATPNFVTPTPTNRTRPLISPSKLGHSTSWVAGGYWGAESDRQNIFNVDGSRSSSQSSGFESQTSSMNQRNVFSQPPSREESVCGEPMVLDRFPNMSNLSSYHTPQNFSRIGSPVYPQMQYNGHVHIPQARFAQQSAPNMFIQQTYVQNGMFKTPSGSGLIKLPQVNSFSSH